MSLSTLLHSSGVLVFGYALYFDMYLVHLSRPMVNNGFYQAMVAFPGKWKYLTIWNVVLQIAYHGVALAADAIGGKKLKKFRDGMFVSWALPVGAFVSLSFWTLYLIDRRLVYPPELDAIFPAWFNHAVHSGPLAYVSIGLICLPKRIYPKRYVGVGWNLALSCAYSGWTFLTSLYTGVWPYPILEVMSMGQRAGFIGSSAITILFIYFIAESYNSRRLEEDEEEEEEDLLVKEKGN